MSDLSRLTLRQQETLALIVAGLSNREIAIKLNISSNTVARHINQILSRTGTTNRTQAAVWYERYLSPWLLHKSQLADRGG